MKLICLSAMVLATASGAAPIRHPAPKTPAQHSVSESKPLPIFNFMGNTTEAPATLPTGCDPIGDKAECTTYGDPEMAGTKVEYLSQMFYQGRLYEVLSGFHDWAYPKILAAFNEKYGTPDVAETRKWQSKGGSTFDNAVWIWHFKGGDLELDSMGSQVDDGMFVFRSAANAPPADKPKVDF